MARLVSQGDQFSQTQLKYLGGIPKSNSRRRKLLQSSSGIDAYYDIQKVAASDVANSITRKKFLKICFFVLCFFPFLLAKLNAIISGCTQYLGCRVFTSKNGCKQQLA